MSLLLLQFAVGLCASTVSLVHTQNLACIRMMSTVEMFANCAKAVVTQALVNTKDLVVVMLPSTSNELLSSGQISSGH